MIVVLIITSPLTVGTAVGAAVGAVGDPVGTLVGASVGACVGAITVGAATDSWSAVGASMVEVTLPAFFKAVLTEATWPAIAEGSALASVALVEAATTADAGTWAEKATDTPGRREAVAVELTSASSSQVLVIESKRPRVAPYAVSYTRCKKINVKQTGM